MTNQEQYALAIAIAAHAHKDQYTEDGYPYILHPLHVAAEVMRKYRDPLWAAAAVLHDVIEDCDITYEDLAMLGVCAFVIDVVRELTHNPDVTYAAYLRAMILTPSLAVKLEDIRHNLDVNRSCSDVGVLNHRIRKYVPAYILVRSRLLQRGVQCVG